MRAIGLDLEELTETQAKLDSHRGKEFPVDRRAVPPGAASEAIRIFM
jgi:hypothetical protein